MASASTRPEFHEWRPHPWHGLEAGRQLPLSVNAYIEITPFDLIKYEVDKTSGYVKVDRPQRTSSQPPSLYGFIPKTYCGAGVAALCPGAQRGDGDPLDICVLSERTIERNGFLLEAIPLGGLRMLDGNQADDKILAVLAGDVFFGEAKDLDAFPKALVDRLRHYFLTYKTIPGETTTITVDPVYDAPEARAVIAAARDDYRRHFGDAGT
jgi:inorganic pyrophosphatase